MNVSHGTRTLLVDYILKRKTDANTYVSSQEIVDILKGIGINASINTIREDFHTIKEFNSLIVNSYKEVLQVDEPFLAGNIEIDTVKKKGALVKKHIFSISELIILFKFIENSFYLSNEEKEKIMQKITVNSSIPLIKQYHLHDGFDNSMYYNENTNALTIISVVQKAISLDTCLRFKYYTFDIRGSSFNRVILNKEYHIYPIRFIMEGNYLYVIGYDLSDCYSYNKNRPLLKVKNYRIDRITHLQTTEKIQIIDDVLSSKTVQEDKSKVNNHINGFGGEENITLKLKVWLVDSIEKTPFKVFVDRFGKQITQVERYGDYILFSIENVLYGVGLIHYLFSFDKQIEVVEPIFVRNEMINIIKKLSEIYTI